MTEFYNFFILNIKYLIGFTAGSGLWLLGDVYENNSRWLKEKYL